MRDTRAYEFACQGLLRAVRKACEPRYEDVRFPLTQTIPYYGKPVDVAVWWAKYVMREARKLGLLHGYERRTEREVA